MLQVLKNTLFPYGNCQTLLPNKFQHTTLHSNNRLFYHPTDSLLNASTITIKNPSLIVALLLGCIRLSPFLTETHILGHR